MSKYNIKIENYRINPNVMQIETISFIEDNLKFKTDIASVHGYKGLLLYAKLPIVGSNNKLAVAIDYDSNFFATLMDEAPLFYLSKGSTAWKTVYPVDINVPSKAIELPDGFEGYINLPFSSFDNEVTRGISNISLCVVNTSKVDNDAFFGPFFLTKNTLFSLDGAWIDQKKNTDGNVVVQNLFTGEEVCIEQLRGANVLPLQAEQEVTQLPECTLEAWQSRVSYRVICDKTVKFDWVPLDITVSAYRLEIYKKNAENEKYIFMGSASTVNTTVTVDFLENDTSYYAVLIALGDNEIIGVYEHTTVEIDSSLCYYTETENLCNHGDLKVQLLPLGDNKNCLLVNNPDRGFRIETFVDVYKVACAGPDREKMIAVAYDDMVGWRKVYAEIVREHFTISFVYIYLDYWKYTGIDEQCITALEAVFEAYRRLGIKMRINLVFQRDLTQLSENDRERGIGASQEIILDTIKKLRDVVYKNRDVIYAFPITSMIGAFGEGGHGGWENPKLDKPILYNEIVKKLVPEDTYIVARMPEYKNFIDKTLPVYNRIGFCNDAFYGMIDFSNSGSGSFNYGNWRWEQMKREAPYAPNDAEFFIWGGYVRDYVQMGHYPDGVNVIRALTDARMTTLNIQHSYGDAVFWDKVPFEKSLFGLMDADIVTPEILEQYGFIYSKAWFYDKNGELLQRSALEYIREHLGYRLEAKRLNIKGDISANSSIDVQLSLINVGFGAAFNLKSGFAVLDEDDNVVIEVGAGKPSEWYSTSPKNCYDRTLLCHNLTTALKLPESKGNYRLAFYLKNTMGQFARLANELDYVNGYNILYSFTI